MKLIDDWNGIITIQAVKNITKAGEVVPQLFLFLKFLLHDGCNGVQREHNKKLNNGLPILHKVPPK